MNTHTLLMPVILTLSLGGTGCNRKDPAPTPRRAPLAAPTHVPATTMNIRVNIGDKTLAATLADNPTARDFASLLPLTLTMNDLFGREKYARLPRAMSDGGKREYTYEAGQIIYWSPGPDVAIYYKDDGAKIPEPGIIVLGKVDAGVEALNVPGSVRVTITRD